MNYISPQAYPFPPLQPRKQATSGPEPCSQKLVTYPFAVTDTELIIDFTSLFNAVGGRAVASCIESGSGVLRTQGKCQSLVFTWDPPRKMVQPRPAHYSTSSPKASPERPEQGRHLGWA